MMDHTRSQEVRELKLGASFTNPNARTVYHTLKYDFKPASVDLHKEATLQTGSNNQVTVTVPHLDGSGVPNTIFKGNQRDSSKKECVLIINRETNEIILEKLHSNIQVKKTRTDSSSKQPPQQQQQPLVIVNNNSNNNNNSGNQTTSSSNNTERKVENQTARHSSKTRVSTGLRKNNILNFVPKHSPLQGSPSYPHPHRSPQQAPLWNANNTQQTLPSIPSLLDDAPFANNQPSTASTSMPKQQQQQQQQQQSSAIMQQQTQQRAIDDIGVLSSSESSSDSNDDSDSDSDSADSSANTHMMNNNNNTNMANNNNSNHKKAPTSNMSNHMDTAILRKDLCLSDSNSDSDF